MTRLLTATSAALIAVSVLALAGCAGQGQAQPIASRTASAGVGPVDATSSPEVVVSAAPTTAMTAGVPLYLVDTNTNNLLGETLPTGLLSGVKGTIPGAEISSQFKEQLLAIDPTLQNFSYAAEAYDAVILAALAAAAAGTDAGVEMAKQLVPITQGTEACTDFAGCVALLQTGASIDYNGRSGTIDFSPAGDPTRASIGVYQFGPDNKLLPDVTYEQGEIQPSGKANPIDGVVQKGADDGVFTVATFLPTSGSLSFLGPAEVAGVKLAIADIEAAGGIPGIDSIVLYEGDSGDTSTDTGQLTLKSLLPRKPDVLIGAASSSSTLSVLDKVTGSGILMISPANTLPSLSTARDHGLFWRTAPSDVLEGAFLGSVVLRDGHTKVAILARDDVYGDSLRANVAQVVNEGGGEVVANITYDPESNDFAAQAARIKAAQPDAIVLIGAYESGQIITELVKQGIGPNSAG